MKRERRYDIELLRIFAMLSIVMGHCFAIYGVWETSLSLDRSTESFVYRGVNPLLIYWALPIFTAISGYLIGYRGVFTSGSFNYKAFIWKKAKRLYFPAVFFSLLYALLFHREVFYDIRLLSRVFIDGQGHLWFLCMLFLLYVLAYPVYLLCQKRTKYWGMFLCSMVICVVSCFFPLGTSIFTVFFYQVFFFIGAYIGSGHKARRPRQARSMWLNILARGVLYVVAFYFLSVTKESRFVTCVVERYPSFLFFQHWFFRMLIGLLAIVLTFPILPISAHLCEILQRAASLSYKIYIVHQFILVGLLNSVAALLMDLHQVTPLLFPFILFGIVVTASVCISICFCQIPILKDL